MFWLLINGMEIFQQFNKSGNKNGYLDTWCDFHVMGGFLLMVDGPVLLEPAGSRELWPIRSSEAPLVWQVVLWTLVRDSPFKTIVTLLFEKSFWEEKETES